MTTIEEADSWIGRTALDSTGEQIGMVTQIWVDDASGQPEWASLSRGVLRGRTVVVPLAGSAGLGSGRQFAYSKEQILDAPAVAPDGHLAAADTDRIADYYGGVEGEQATAPASANWTDRVGDASEQLRQRGTAPVGDSSREAPAEPKAKRSFGRKAAPSEPKAGRRFGRRGGKASADQAPAEAPPELAEAISGHDEVPVGG